MSPNRTSRFIEHNEEDSGSSNSPPKLSGSSSTYHTPPSCPEKRSCCSPKATGCSKPSPPNPTTSCRSETTQSCCPPYPHSPRAIIPCPECPPLPPPTYQSCCADKLHQSHLTCGTQVVRSSSCCKPPPQLPDTNLPLSNTSLWSKLNIFRGKSTSYSSTDLELDSTPPRTGPVTTQTFNVEGLTCSSCESSLKDCLLSIPGIDQVSVSVVLSRAVVEGNVSSADIIRIASQKTKFKLTSLENQPTLYLMFNAKDVQETPPGVEVSRYGKTIKFIYDAHKIGGREIYEFYTKLGYTPEIVDSVPATTSRWNTLGTRVLTSIILSIPVLVLAYTPPHPPTSGSIQLILVTLIMVYVIYPLYFSALSTLFRRHEIEMDLLVVMSTSIAYIYSVVAFGVQTSGGEIGDAFWETPALLATLIMTGRWIVMRAREKAVKEVKRCSSDLNVRTARLTTADGQIKEVDVRLLGYGDIVHVDPAETVPSDGEIIHGGTEVSEAMFTGESTPVHKLPGSTVYAGSHNLLAPIDIKVTKLPQENTLSGIRDLINSAQITKPRIQSYTDRIAGYIGPISLLCAILAFVTWTLINKLVRREDTSAAAVGGLMYAIAILAVTCPCTIGLAVPMNVVIASGLAAKQGILIKDSKVLEVMHRVKRVVFDKTGTLTKGEMIVVEKKERKGAREVVRLLVRGQKHPVAKAVEKYVNDIPGDDDQQDLGGEGEDGNIQVIVGRGLEVKIPEGVLRGGNLKWLGLANPFKEEMNLSTFAVTLNGKLIAAYGLTDELRPEAKEVVNSLQSRGIEVYLVSGDNREVTEDIARKLNIPLSQVHHSILPSSKATIIKYLQSPDAHPPSRCPRPCPVAFIGDGLNDAPALSAADVAVSFIHASQLTLSTSSVLLLNPHLTSILTLMQLSKRVYRRIVINFVWAAIYNVFAIALAAGVFVVWRIEARWAGVGEVVSVLPVVLVGWSLRWRTKW